MSQPRRRRRRSRRRRSTPKSEAPTTQAEQQASDTKPPGSRARSRKSRSGRRRGSGQQRTVDQPLKSSEDIVRAGPKRRPENLTAPPDGQKLEDIIKELQSAYGVPQYPQEYRLTFKVADNNKDGRSDRSPGARRAGRPAAVGEQIEGDAAVADPGGPKREKAPAAPGVKGGGAPDGTDGTKRRRRRRRRRGHKSG